MINDVTCLFVEKDLFSCWIVVIKKCLRRPIFGHNRFWLTCAGLVYFITFVSSRQVFVKKTMLGSIYKRVDGFVFMVRGGVNSTINSGGVAYYVKWKVVDLSLKPTIVARCMFLVFFEEPLLLLALGLLLVTKTPTCAYFNSN